VVSNSSDFDEVSIVTLTETVLTWHQLKRERGEREREMPGARTKRVRCHD
jgi:hypothetical protein